MKINVSKKNTPALKVSFLMALANKFLEVIGFTGIINDHTEAVSKNQTITSTQFLDKPIAYSTLLSVIAAFFEALAAPVVNTSSR